MHTYVHVHIHVSRFPAADGPFLPAGVELTARVATRPRSDVKRASVQAYERTIAPPHRRTAAPSLNLLRLLQHDERLVNLLLELLLIFQQDQQLGVVHLQHHSRDFASQGRVVVRNQGE